MKVCLRRFMWHLGACIGIQEVFWCSVVLYEVMHVSLRPQRDVVCFRCTLRIVRLRYPPIRDGRWMVGEDMS